MRVLFVGEAPPASGVFFYAANSGLFRAIHRTFADVQPAPADAFLAQFRDLGCYLVDLCADPVDKLAKAAREQARSVGEPGLAAGLRRWKPAVVVVLLRVIAPNVERAALAAGWAGELVSVPYPGQWHAHRAAFAATMIPLLRRWLDDGTVASP